MAYLSSHMAGASAGVARRIGGGWDGAISLAPCFWQMLDFPQSPCGVCWGSTVQDGTFTPMNCAWAGMAEQLELGWDSPQHGGLRVVGFLTLWLASHRAHVARVQGGSGKASYDLTLRSHAVSPLLHSLSYSEPTPIHCGKGPNKRSLGVVAQWGRRHLWKLATTTANRSVFYFLNKSLNYLMLGITSFTFYYLHSLFFPSSQNIKSRSTYFIDSGLKAGQAQGV